MNAKDERKYIKQLSKAIKHWEGFPWNLTSSGPKLAATLRRVRDAVEAGSLRSLANDLDALQVTDHWPAGLPAAVLRAHVDGTYCYESAR